MPDHAEIQHALDAFGQSAEPDTLNEVLLAPIQDIARTGIVSYKWSSLVCVLVHRLRTVLREGPEGRPGEVAGYHGEGTYEDASAHVCMMLSTFDGPPFTIQRLCELLLEPQRHHRSRLKLLTAVDKLLSVTTLVPEYTEEQARAILEASNRHQAEVAARAQGAAGGADGADAMGAGEGIATTGSGEAHVDDTTMSDCNAAGAGMGEVGQDGMQVEMRGADEEAQHNAGEAAGDTSMES